MPFQAPGSHHVGGREVRIQTVCLSGLIALTLGLACGEREAADSGQDLHRSAIVVDTHSDTTPRFEDPDWDFGSRHALDDGHMDLPRIREGGLDVQFWSIFGFGCFCV